MGKVETTWRTMEFNELNPAEYNPRKIKDKAMAGLQNSLDEFGLLQNLVWNRRTKNLVSGHQRMKALASQGETEAMVCEIDVSLEIEKKINVTLNNRHIQGSFDAELQSLLRDAREDDEKLFRDVHLDELLKDDIVVPVIFDMDMSSEKRFWISVRGLLGDQADAIDVLREHLGQIEDLEVNIGVIQ